MTEEEIGPSDDVLLSKMDSPGEVRQFVSECGCPEQVVSRKNSNAIFRNLDHLAEYFPMVARTTPQAFFGRPPKAVRPRSPPVRPQISISGGSTFNLPTRPSPVATKHEAYVNGVLNDPHDDLYEDSNSAAAGRNGGAGTENYDGDGDDADQNDDDDDDDVEMDTPDNRSLSERSDSHTMRRVSTTDTPSDTAIVEPRSQSDQAPPRDPQNRPVRKGRTVPSRNDVSAAAEAENRRELSRLQVKNYSTLQP